MEDFSFDKPHFQDANMSKFSLNIFNILAINVKISYFENEKPLKSMEKGKNRQTTTITKKKHLAQTTIMAQIHLQLVGVTAMSMLTGKRTENVCIKTDKNIVTICELV